LGDSRTALQGMDDDAAFIEQCQAAVERRLAELTPDRDARPARLAEAARYALLSPGKRFRPMLTLLTAREFGGDPAAALDVACACEMVHAASLILDDLPCMDDAGLRRGRVTTHKAFDEATAVLASVGLLNLAYGVVACAPGLAGPLKADLAARLSRAVGFSGLVAGQAMDLEHRDRARAPEDLDLLNHRKTGVLMVAAAEAGALIAGASSLAVLGVGEFATHLGLAFQIHDDILDVEGGADLGKDVGKDAGMTTLVSAIGLEGARVARDAHLKASDAGLARSGVGQGLLARYVHDLFEARKAAA
jgi:geranylgeranyl diphosphate synthase type II